MDDQADLPVASDAAAKQAVVERRNPWTWVTESRLTYAAKLLLVILLALYIGSFALAFFERIHTIVLILVAAIFFAYLIYPIVNRLRRYMHLVFAILLVYAAIFAVLVTTSAFLVPRLMDDVASLATHYPEFANRAQVFINDPNNPLLAHLPENVRVEVIRIPERLAEWFRIHGIEAVSHAFTIVIGTF